MKRILNICFLTLMVFCTCSLFAQKHFRMAEKGILDLRNFDFKHDGVIKLDGEWEFYWQKIIHPDSFSDKTDKVNYINVPQNWKNHIVDSITLPNEGFATYRLVILIDSSLNLPLTLIASVPGIATKSFVNGIKAASSGEVGKTKSETKHSFAHNYESLFISGNKIEIIVHTSNFVNPQGGLFSSLYLGIPEEILKVKAKEYTEDSIILGAFLLIVVFHLILFLLRRKDVGSLYFALSATGFFINYFITHGTYSNYFPDLSYSILYRSLFFSLNLVVVSLYLFIYYLFPEEYKKTAIRIIVGISFIYFLLPIIPGNLIFEKIVAASTQIYLVISSIYTLFVLFKAFIRKRQDSGVFLIGLLILILSMVNDTLHNLDIIKTISVVNFGLLIFFLFQSYIISARFSRAFTLSEKLAVDLQTMNENLETKVIERTHEIAQQKEEILTQAEQLKAQNDKLVELDQFKQGLTSMIVHDLKTPLNTILNLSEKEISSATEDKQGMIKNLGGQMLNMVLNILDVSKFEETNITLQLEEHSLQQIVNKAMLQVDFLAKQKNIQILNKIPEELDVFCDMELISRVFINLMTNAIKYSPHNADIEIASYNMTGKTLPEELKQIKWRKSKIDKQILITVKDYGKGMEKEEISRIFQKFTQIEPQKSGNIKSTGLGLYFCKLAIEAHGGEIGVFSEINTGSTFGFYLETAQINTNIDITIQDIKGENEQIIFSDEDHKNIKPYLTLLAGLKYYEITQIKRILNSIDTASSNSIKSWIKQVELAVKNCNEEKYETLIKPL